MSMKKTKQKPMNNTKMFLITEIVKMKKIVLSVKP